MRELEERLIAAVDAWHEKNKEHITGPADSYMMAELKDIIRGEVWYETLAKRAWTL